MLCLNSARKLQVSLVMRNIYTFTTHEKYWRCCLFELGLKILPHIFCPVASKITHASSFLFFFFHFSDSASEHTWEPLHHASVAPTNTAGSLYNVIYLASVFCLRLRMFENAPWIFRKNVDKSLTHKLLTCMSSEKSKFFLASFSHVSLHMRDLTCVAFEFM